MVFGISINSVQYRLFFYIWQIEQIDGFALSNMTNNHFDQMGLKTLGDRLTSGAFCAPKRDDFDEKIERLKEALSSRESGKESRVVQKEKKNFKTNS